MLIHNPHKLLLSTCLHVLQVVLHPKVTELADVMVSVLGLMTALAAGPKGSRYLMQLFKANAAHEQLHAFTWQKLFM
jgi:hypothetical protein